MRQVSVHRARFSLEAIAAADARRAADHAREEKMPTVSVRRITVIALGAWVAAAAPTAHAQTSVKALFEKYNLLGTFAFDCAKAASTSNFYYVNRMLDGGQVQRDRMSGTTTRDFIVYIDQASELKPNEIALGGTRDSKPQEAIWRIERKAGDDVRVLAVEASWDGKKQISGGKLVPGGQSFPWTNKCGK
jgi:hypothetical protein